VYLITFSCYGSHLHGEEGRIDRRNNMPGSRAMPADSKLLEQSKGLMNEAPYVLDAARRAAALRGMHQACASRECTLLAAHVRSNHVHAVVRGDTAPEKVMHALKAYASRALNARGLDIRGRKRWTRHGSTRYLWTQAQIERAIRYVVAGQGEPMEVYCRER
jgi:REP element-mobilizing transposase RayT